MSNSVSEVKFSAAAVAAVEEVFKKLERTKFSNVALALFDLGAVQIDENCQQIVGSLCPVPKWDCKHGLVLGLMPKIDTECIAFGTNSKELERQLQVFFNGNFFAVIEKFFLVDGVVDTADGHYQRVCRIVNELNNATGKKFIFCEEENSPCSGEGRMY